jgi:hypothetical protein
MKKAFAALFLAAAACSSGGGDRRSDEDFEIQMAATIKYDTSLLKVGDRATYLVKRAGDAQSQKYVWSAVAEERGAVWIENSIPWNTKRAIYKYKFDRSNNILELWVGEPGGVPGQTYPPPSGRAPTPAPHERDSGSAKAEEKEEFDRIVVSGKSYDCTRVTTVLNYPDGRKSTMTNWFSKEVSFPLTKTLGGLVKRQFGRLSMELVGSDQNAKAELQIPGK